MLDVLKTCSVWSQIFACGCHYGWSDWVACGISNG